MITPAVLIGKPAGLNTLNEVLATVGVSRTLVDQAA